MFNLDPSKIAKGAVEGLQKAEKRGGDAGEAAKNVLQGIKKAEKLAGLSGQAPEQVIAALRKLLAEAKQLAKSLPKKNEALDACIQEAEKLLDSGSASTEAVTKLTAQLGSLLKDASAGTAQPAASAASASANRSTSTPQPAAPAAAAQKAAVQFSDVDAGAYYYDAVQWAVQEGIASGTSETTFSPDQECTCGQTITLLWRSAGSPTPKGQNNPFMDVNEGAYYCKAVLWAAENGIVSGTAFAPDTAITRGQFAMFLHRKAGSPAAGKSSFTDVPDSADYSQAVAWVAAQGIASGTGENTFSPDAVCTRGQIVTFLYRARNK